MRSESYRSSLLEQHGQPKILCCKKRARDLAIDGRNCSRNDGLGGDQVGDGS